MSYIGNTPANQNFVAGADQFSGTGSQLAFTLSRNVNTVFDIFVAISNVPQDPYSAYSVSGSTLTFTSAPPSGTGNIYVTYRATNVQTFVPSPGATVGGSFGIQGNLNFFGTGNRITGDFSNATVANRVIFQSSTTNGNTVINLIPNGTATTCAFGMDTDPALTNSSTGSFNLVASTDVRLAAGIRGTGTYLPITFYTNGSERARIATNGDFSFNSGYGSAAVAYGCRAWVNFNGSGTVAIRGSGNVTSITDNGVGNYTVNFTTAMPDANYGVNFGVGGGGAGLNSGFVAGVLTSTQYGTASNKTTSVVQFTTGDYTATLRDLGEIYVSIFR